jgi:hypothetical protein
LTTGVDATGRLAAKVARNADDETFSQLIARAATQEPLAAAATLLMGLMTTAKDAGRPQLEAEAVASATELLAAQSWQDPRLWTDNRPHMRKLLGWTASVTSDSDVRTTLTTAINQDPELLPAVLLGMAQWSEQRDATAFDRILDVTFGIETLPSWFPTEILAATIRHNLPHVEPADEDSSTQYDDDVDRLASQVLWLAES